jgi:hypothetical protein
VITPQAAEHWIQRAIGQKVYHYDGIVAIQASENGQRGRENEGKRMPDSTGEFCLATAFKPEILGCDLE